MLNLEKNLKALLKANEETISKDKVKGKKKGIKDMLTFLIGQNGTKALIHDMSNLGINISKDNKIFIYDIPWEEDLSYKMLVDAINKKNNYNDRVKYLKNLLLECADNNLDWMYNNLLNNIKKVLSLYNIKYSINDAYELLDIIYENIIFNINIDTILKKKINISIFINNSDFNKTADLLEKGSIIEDLVEGQGYTLHQLKKVVGGSNSESTFLNSLSKEITHVDLINSRSASNFLTVLVKMTLEELLRLNELEYMYIKKDTMMGIVDPYKGDGGSFNIVLERDMYLPIKNVLYSLEEDMYNQVYDIYTIQQMHDFDLSFWKNVEFFTTNRESVYYNKPIILDHSMIEKDVLIYTDSNQRVLYNGKYYEYYELIYIYSIDKWSKKEIDISLDRVTVDEALKELRPYGYSLNEILHYPLLLVEAIGENDYDFDIFFDNKKDALYSMSIPM